MKIAALLFCLLTVPVAAQDRAGNDTPGEWKVTHHTAFGLWDSMCDERQSGETLEQRCYLRYVDVFSPHPKFGAIFAFIGPDNSVEFGFEQGTAFKRNGFYAKTAGTRSWTMPHRPCLFGGACQFEADQGAQLLETFSKADALVFDFVDRHGQAQVREWDMTVFAPALADHRAQSAARGL